MALALSTWVELLLLVTLPAAVGLGYKWVFAPLLVWWRFRMAADLEYRTTRDDELTPDMREHLGTFVRGFAAEGFKVVDNLTAPNAATGVRSTVVVLLYNREAGALATVMGSLADNGRSVAAVVTTLLAGDRRLHTCFNRTASIFPPHPLDDSATGGWITDPRALCEFHRRRVAAATGRGAELAPLPPPGGEVAFHHASEARFAEWYRRAGYRRLDRAGRNWRLTLKGAFLASWRLMDPFKSRRMRERERIARSQWDALGMNDWRPPTGEGDAPLPVPAVVPPPTGTTPPPLPPAQVRGPLPAAAPLVYEQPLAEGEVRGVWSGPELHVRVGGQTPGRYLASRWTSFFWIALLAYLVATSLMSLVSHWRLRRLGFRMPWEQVGLAALWAFWLVLAVVKLVRGARRARGDVRFVASPRGLAYHNTADGSAEGFVAKDEIESLFVAAAEYGIFRSEYRLVALRYGNAKPLPLLSGPKKQRVVEAQAALLAGLGMALPAPSEQAAGAATVARATNATVPAGHA
ncbi:MAG TPA: hypothetical protein VF796_25475 [Humisphaera sp.]